MILSEARKKNLHFAEDSIHDFSMNAVIYVLRRFRQNGGYRVKKNFTSAIYFGCKHSLFYRTKSDILLADLYKLLNHILYSEPQIFPALELQY